MRYDRRQLWRETAAGLALWSLGALALTGLVLYAVLWTSPEEGTAPALLGLSLDQWADVHDVLGIAFVAAGLATLALGRPVWPSAPVAHGLAAAAVTVIFGLTLMHLPPASWLLPESYPREPVAAAEEEAGALPYPGAEGEPLAALAREMAMDPTRVVIALQESGLHFESLDETLEAVAEHNGTTPAVVYDAIRHLEAPLLAPHEEAPFDVVESRFMGHDVRGKTVAQLAEAASVPLDLALRRLRAAGIDAKPGELADTVAANSGVTPMDVLAALVVEGYRPRR